MNAEQLQAIIAGGRAEAMESAWTQAVDKNLPIEQLAKALEAIAKAGQLNLAETLGWALIEERAQQLDDLQQVPIVQAVVSAVAMSDQLRSQAAELYRRLHGNHEHFEAMLKASGLQSGQSPRRAFRTLDTCLALQVDDYLANRFDGRVLRAGKYNPVMDEFELFDARGGSIRLEPKKMADEFDRVEPSDFRVLCQHRPQELSSLLQANPASVLIGICQSAGGRIDANALKEMLVPAHLAKEEWPSWWNKARTAAKRSENLALDGRPIVVSYHSAGRSLEDEMAAQAKAAAMPLEKLGLLQTYVREARARKVDVQQSFVTPIVEALAEQAESFAIRRASDALAAALALDIAGELGLPAATKPYPTAAEILGVAAKPATAVAQLEDAGLFTRALDALQTRADGAEQLAALVVMTPAGQLDELHRRLIASGQAAAVSDAVASAVAEPVKYLEIYLWLWKGPANRPENMPGKVELLRRLLLAVHDLDHDWDMDPASRKEIRQKIRNALSANDYAAFQQAAEEMDEAVAGTIKRLIERTEGLAEAVYDGLMSILRERFYKLFVKTKLPPWMDENELWTTEAALSRREDELKYHVDVKMFENAKAIGAAAEHGDLSENSEWKFALEERDLLRARAAKMQEELVKARVIQPESVPTNSVGIGSKVTLTSMADNTQTEVAFLGPWDSDLEKRVYSYQTPVGLALMGKTIGDVVTVKIDGQEGQFRIDALGSAFENGTER